MREKILTNKIKCLKCGDIIESIHVHDFNYCSCGRVAVDGGREYLRRCFHECGDYEDLSQTSPMDLTSDVASILVDERMQQAIEDRGRLVNTMIDAHMMSLSPPKVRRGKKSKTNRS